MCECVGAKLNEGEVCMKKKKHIKRRAPLIRTLAIPQLAKPGRATGTDWMQETLLWPHKKNS